MRRCRRAAVARSVVNMFTTLYRSAAAWTGVGLASGLFYRELTKHNAFTGQTQLSVVHTHTLVLGTVILLLLLGLNAMLRLDLDRRFRWGILTWNIGLTLTAGGMLVKGVFQVLQNAAADSPAIAGVSGLGHIVLTLAFVLIFLAIGARAKTLTDTPAQAGEQQLAV